MEQALRSAKANGITEVYATLWGDDGAETPMIASLLGLQLFSEAQFYATPSREIVTDHLKLFHGSQAEDFLCWIFLTKLPVLLPKILLDQIQVNYCFIKIFFMAFMKRHSERCH